MRLRQLKKKGSSRQNLFAALITVLSVLGVPTAHAATVNIDYSLSGGAAFYTATGTVTASVNYTVLGITRSQSITGYVSGATSWNIAGNMSVAVDNTGSISTISDLTASRRAGQVDINYPLLDLGGLGSFNLDSTIASRNNGMVLGAEAGTLLNDTDWFVTQDYLLPSGISVSLTQAGVTSNEHMPLFPQLLSLINGPGLSSASLISPTGSLSLGFVNGAITPGCQYWGALGNCLASVNSVAFDFSNAFLTTSALAATGTSTTLLPTVVPIPAAAWLFGSGLIGLIGVARRKKA